MTMNPNLLFLQVLLVLSVSYVFTRQEVDIQYCEAGSKFCDSKPSSMQRKYLFYDVNPTEGFNLRRDVYMRFAIMLADARKSGKRLDWTLVLPPWYDIYHWKTTNDLRPIFWNRFFDIDSLKTFVPVVELHEVLSESSDQVFVIDTLYVLLNYMDPFENGTFEEKWEIIDDNCHYSEFWGFSYILANETVCVKFQGKASMLWELIAQHPSDKTVMFHYGEVALHNNYGTKTYWDCRKSMRFNKQLNDTANKYIQQNLDCAVNKKCKSYVGVHWRRKDFARNRANDVPSITETAKQIHNFIQTRKKKLNKIFIATDASKKEYEQLKHELSKYNLNNVYKYEPSKSETDKYGDGGIAIIDQIICSRAAHFIGTHESTFSFRIQEEREILGYPKKTTFNRFCPDQGECERMSMWTIVH